MPESQHSTMEQGGPGEGERDREMEHVNGKTDSNKVFPELAKEQTDGSQR